MKNESEVSDLNYRWQQGLLYLLLFLLPFERVPSWEIAGVTVRLSSFVIIVFIFSGLPSLVIRRRWGPLSAIDRAILGYWFIGLISSLWALQFQRALLVSLLWAVVLAAYVLITRTLRRSYDKLKIFRTLQVTALITALFGLYQFIANSYFGVSSRWTLLAPNYERSVFGFARIQSVGVEPLYYANFLLLPIFLLISYLCLRPKIEKKYAGLLFILVTTFILTLSRGGYLAFLVGLLLIAGACVWWKKSLRQGVLVGLIVVAAFIGSQVSIALVGKVGNRQYASENTSALFGEHALGGESTRSASINPRLDVLKDAARIFEEHPLFGVGLGNYSYYTQLPKTNSTPIVNNQYLETLTETGILGFAFFATLICLVLAKLWRLLRQHRGDWFVLGMAVTVVGLGVQYNFFSTIYILFVWVVIGLVEALPEAKYEKRTGSNRD